MSLNAYRKKTFIWFDTETLTCDGYLIQADHDIACDIPNGMSHDQYEDSIQAMLGRPSVDPLLLAAFACGATDAETDSDAEYCERILVEQLLWDILDESDIRKFVLNIFARRFLQEDTNK